MHRADEKFLALFGHSSRQAKPPAIEWRIILNLIEQQKGVASREAKRIDSRSAILVTAATESSAFAEKQPRLHTNFPSTLARILRFRSSFLWTSIATLGLSGLAFSFVRNT